MLRAALLALSAILAVAYGAFGSSLYDGAPPYIVGTIFKASGIIVLGAIAIWSAGAPAGQHQRLPARVPAVHNKLLAAGLLFGALGDALLAWSPDTFLYGAFAFLIGHLFYITLFLRAGIGVGPAFKHPPRLIAAIALIIAAVVMTSLLVPRDNSMFAPLSIYTGVLTLMALTSFTLPATRWLAMLGAVLFFISDGFVAANLFHPLDDPTFAYWRSFAGWMIYWAGQAAICFGALGLHKAEQEAT
ncbi:MAG: lysoplasmalogenase [Hyphomonadaceae bacterium]|nr:lysoplasmalogenase [Hyphomonadaceae bacterium]